MRATITVLLTGKEEDDNKTRIRAEITYYPGHMNEEMQGIADSVARAVQATVVQLMSPGKESETLWELERLRSGSEVQ